MNATTTKQIQKAGDNANQIQTQTLVQNIGMSEERVYDIVSAACDKAIESCLMESRLAVEQRLNSFKDELYVIVGNQLQLFESLREPSCAATLGAAANAAARTNSAADHQMLAELLVKRFESPSDRHVATGVSKAIEIVEYVTDEELAGLTTLHVAGAFTPVSGDIKNGIESLAGLIDMLPLELLPSGQEWIDDLDILGAVRSSPIASLVPYLDIQFKQLDGYTVCGVKAGSDEEAEAMDKLSEVGLPANLLVEHELNPGYKRLPLRHINNFEGLSLYSSSDPSASQTELNSDQIKAFRYICNLSKDNSCDEVIKGNLKKEMFRYPSLATLIDWWDSIRLALRLTSVGRCLASSNARRLKPELPEF